MRKLFISFLLLACSTWAQAAAPVLVWNSGFGGYFQDIAGAGNAMAAAYTANASNPIYTYIDATPAGYAHFTKTPRSGGTPTDYYYQIGSSYRCYPNWTAPVSSLPWEQQCSQSPPPTGPQCDVPAGKPVTFTYKTGSKVPNGSDGGNINSYPKTSPKCGLTELPYVGKCYSVANADGATKDYYCEFNGTSNGQNAPAGTPAGDTPPAGNQKPETATTPADSTTGKCPRGTVQAGYDSAGTPICMGTGTNPGPSSSSAPTSTTTNGTDAAGNATQTTTTSSTNSDGSTTTTTTTTTTAPDGTKTVTGSTTTGTATNGSQGQQDKPADDFCKQHPDLMVCRNSSVTGSCGTIACSGDAIQCATLQQAAALRCARDDEEKALKASAAHVLGQAVLNGADPSATKLPTPANATAVNVASSLDTSGWLGGGSCFPDKVIVVSGRSITLPFGQACGLLVVFRYALMVVAGLLSFKVLRGSILGE